MLIEKTALDNQDEFIKKYPLHAKRLGLLTDEQKRAQEVSKMFGDVDFKISILQDEINQYGVLAQKTSDSQKINEAVEKAKRDGIIKTKEEIEDYISKLQTQLGMEAELAQRYFTNQEINSALAGTIAAKKQALVDFFKNIREKQR